MRAPPGNIGSMSVVGSNGGGSVFETLGQGLNFGGIRTGSGSMQGLPLQRASELQPGTRGVQGRRAFMFG